MIGAHIFSETKKRIMNRPERTFATQQIQFERRLPSYWRVTFDIPPVDIFGPKEIPQLSEIITAIEEGEQVKIVFDSAVDGFFIPLTTSWCRLRSPQRYHPDQPACRPRRTCWYASAGLQWCS
jgi:hypothetical protein